MESWRKGRLQPGLRAEVLFIVGPSCSYNVPDTELVDTVAFPDVTCNGTKCQIELSTGGRRFILHMEHTVDIAPANLSQQYVFIDKTVSNTFQYPQGCVHYGKFAENGVFEGFVVLDLCEGKEATLYGENDDYSIVPISKNADRKMRRRRSTDTHAVYSMKRDVRIRQKRSYNQPVTINRVITPLRYEGSQIPSYRRISPNRKLRLELAIFVDKEYQDAFYSSPIGSNDPAKMRKHIMDVMKQVQMWYFLPSLGYKIHVYITKVVFIQNTTQETNAYKDLDSFCEHYQTTFLPGGSRAGNSDVGWDAAFFFSGVTGMFGMRSPGSYIYGRAMRWGACNPKFHCAGANDHFDVAKTLAALERYMGRLVTHELSHTLGMADEYYGQYKNRCPGGLMADQRVGQGWSKCSKYELEQFLLSEFSNCLDNIADKNANTVQPVPPGHSTDNAVDGGWGPWTAFGPCSRDCDGVQLAKRKCNNPTPKNFGRVCTGLSYKMRKCRKKSQEKCDRSLSTKTIWELYAEGCKRVPGREKDYEMNIPGIYSLSGTPACGNQCNKKGTTMWDFHKVPDGFKCRDGQDDMCVDGICMTVGCEDENFYSRKRRDICGVCDGDGTTCRVVRGTFYGQKQGWHRITVIPSGARDIFVKANASKQVNMQGNFIELGDSTAGTDPGYISPTEWFAEGDVDKGAYKVHWVGVLWEYMNNPFIPHFLRTRFEPEEEAIVWLRREAGALPNLGIEWQYTIDVNTSEVTTVVPTFQPSTWNVTTALPTFDPSSWIVGGGSGQGYFLHRHLVLAAVLGAILWCFG